MKAHIIQIGNSKGLRLPKTVLEQCGLEDEVELEVRDNHLIIKSSGSSRKGWDEAFQRMHKQHDDQLADLNTATSWDKSDWEW